MADLQVTQEVVVLLNNFHNVDLFQRGYYQVRCRVDGPSKLTSLVECEVKEEGTGNRMIPCLFKSFVDKYNNTAVSKTIEVYYKHEEVQIKDMFMFKVHMLIDSSKIESQLPLKLQLTLELFFGESARSPTTPKSLELASTQVLMLHLSFGESYHAYRPVMFDYFHLGAVNLTVHSCVVALRQPWSAALKALHPIWNGKSGNVRQYTYTALFGKNSSNLQPSEKLEYRHKENVSYMHRKLCLQLLKLYENLLQYYHSVLSLLPDYAQMRLSKVDIDAKLEVLNNEIDALETAEEVYLRMGDDLYLLSTELNMLWMQFAEQFIYEDVLQQRLIEEHHVVRTEHMKEVVFTQDQPWEALCSSLELTTSQQSRMFSNIKSSLYYQLVPPINFECAALDGDSTTMPIIFEDRYIPGKRADKDCTGRVTKLSVSDEAQNNEQSNTSSGCHTNGSVCHANGSQSHQHANTSGYHINNTDTKQDRTEDETKHIAWELSKDKIKSLAETDLTGPDYCSASENTQTETNSAAETNLQIRTASNDDNLPLMSTTAVPLYDVSKKSNSIFYSHGVPHLDSPEVAEEALLIEDLEIADDEDETKTKEIIALSNEQYTNLDDVIESSPATGGSVPRQKLWSCFPTKGSTKGRSPYKVSMVPTPSYLPGPRKMSTRFQRAKENLQINLDIPGHHYSLMSEEITVKPYFTQRLVATTENIHLVVCVHGLDGNCGDLRLVRCFLELALPRTNFDFLMSEINQEDTFCDVDTMTDRLVNEILEYIEEQNLEVVRLSFVGHSLGNIIVRNAVSHSALYLFRNKLHTFLSLSGPHLGMQFHTSNLVSTGMWLMQKWKKGGSLVQLALNDSSDPRDTFMYRLSLTNGFQYFKNVLLVSSVQDHYVPFHSARLEMSKSVVKDNSEGSRVYKEMLDNIMNPLVAQEEVNIVKYSVHHPMAASPNTFIGRAAHIAMLDSELFLEKFILSVAYKYFI